MHILELFQDVADRDDYAGNGRSAEHTDNRDCSLVQSQRYVGAMEVLQVCGGLTVLFGTPKGADTHCEMSSNDGNGYSRTQ